MRTAQVVSSTGNRPLHLRHDKGLDEEQVSWVSRWGDLKWILDNPTKGSPTSISTLNWNFRLPDGSRLTDLRHRTLLDTFKRFVWSLLCAPGDGASAMAVGSIASLKVGVRALVSWMVEHGYSAIHQLDPNVLEGYRRDIPKLIGQDDYDAADPDECISRSQVMARITVVYRLWQQRHALAAAGIRPMPQIPWDGRSATELARSLVTKDKGQILPLPDEVAIPILNAASRLLGVPSDDVIRLVDQYYELKSQHAGKGRTSASVYIRKAIEQFQFSTILGEDEAWRRPLKKATSTPYRAEPRLVGVVQILRHLVDDIKAAAVVVIQATTGMRASEICGLMAGINAATGMPQCVHVERTLDGLHDVFFVEGPLSKTEEAPREVKWVLGLRASGEVTVPLPVRALLVLNLLFRHMRTLSGCDELVLQFRNYSGLPISPNTVGPSDHTGLNVSQRMFVRRYVDLSQLPDTSRRAIEENDLVLYRESKGWCLRTHQWRKTLAHFVFNTDRRLLPALSQQFHHISIAMIDYGYLGRNQALLETFDSVRVQEVTSLLYEMTMETAPKAGRMSEQIEEHIEEIKSLVSDLPPAQGWKKVFEFAELNGIRMWFAPHGKCLPLNYAKMRCHEVAGTLWRRSREPNYDVRQPSLCAGCPCFVLDSRHLPYWRDRYIENTIAWKRAEALGHAKNFRVIRERAAQAANLLRRLGEDLAEEGRLIQQRLDSSGA